MENSTQPASTKVHQHVRSLPENYFEGLPVNQLEDFTAYGPDEEGDIFLSFTNDKGTIYGLWISETDIFHLVDIVTESEPD